MTKQINVVGAAIQNKNKEILCCQRGPGRALANLWEFPGGKIETGESPEVALIREIKEELHAELTVINYIDEASYDYDFGTVTMKVFLCEIKDDYYQLTEHIDSKWISRKELLSIDWAPVDIPIAEALAK